jgi:hypothetical protein
MKIPFLAGWLSFLCLTGCASDRRLSDVTGFLSAVALADEVLVYEGLPHQMWDRDLYRHELARSDLVRFHGYPFYAKPLAVTAEEKKALTAIAQRKDAHVPYGGAKLCGGYHPDYAIVWTRAGQQSGSLICFGCHEWKNFTPEGLLYEDMTQSAYNELKAILGKHVVHRPQKKQP